MGHPPRHRHVARRADDRLRLRRLPLDRSARSAHAAVDPDRAAVGSPPSPFARRGPIDPRRHLHRPARAGAGPRRAPRRRDPLHAQPRRPRPRPRRCAALQRRCSRRRSPATATRDTLGDLRPHVRATSSSRRRSGAAACRSSSLFRIAGPFSLGGVEIVPVPLLHGRLPDSRLPDRLVRLPDRLQPRFPTSRGRCSTACARSCSTRCATGRTRRTSASPKRSRSSRGSAPSARTSRTSATICRTPRPARACRPAWSWPMMGWCWRFDDYRETAETQSTLCCGSRARVDRHGRHSLPRRPAAGALDAPGARARQLRRRAPRPPQDPRPRAARRRRARRHARSS